MDYFYYENGTDKVIFLCSADSNIMHSFEYMLILYFFISINKIHKIEREIKIINIENLKRLKQYKHN